jgi:phosphorylcholine metabolism protein LicD
MKTNNELYVESAKFVQNILLENNIKCFLIGGSLINSIRDNGVLNTDDIDFAILNDNDDVDNMDKLNPIFEKYLGYYVWEKHHNLFSIYIYGDCKKKIDFFKFSKKHLNYYMYDMTWIHERINHFQTFKSEEVILENKSFLTMYRPDLFLKTVYGDYSKPTNEYKNIHGGNTQHLQECVYYIDPNNFETIDFKIENLKFFFKTVLIKKNISDIDKNKINIFDDIYVDKFDTNKNLFYKDFTKFLIKNKIEFSDF